jgi:Uma2 family endonuclease
MRAVIADIPKRWLDEHRASEVAQWDEMWNGELHMAAMPNRFHQRLVRQLQNYLDEHWGKPTGCEIEQEVNLTTPEDEDHWTNNYRIPDLVILDPPRFPIDKIEYMAGAPLVVMEIRSPGDESYEKLPFYAGLGVPEVWIIHRDTKEPDIFVYEDGKYSLQPPDADGWMRSLFVPVAMQATDTGKLRLMIRNDPSTLAEIPRN